MPALQPAQIYKNVMEPLVVEEVEQQVKLLPTKVAQYINKTEVTAYALNRLPPLYATSERGWQQQRTKANRDMAKQIGLAVRQALAAVQQDPIRSTVPLEQDGDRHANQALQELKELLHANDLSWQNLVDIVERELIRTARGEITWSKRGSQVSQSPEWQDRRYML
ncbi:MAG: late competence development ComFB family protein [Leptolyngbyaceae cyanobacterium bins.302]|nr:late competence development ComFB family protein [Leptolyngbyaceae cyanobacterium bins.302]